MTDPYIAKLLEMQNRILDRQAKALEDIAEVLKTGNIFFKVGVKEVCMSGYNLAYQVKLCVDLFARCGYFA